MKVILYMATSINGYITHGKDDSDWVSKEDWKEFDRLKRECGIIVMGKRTYEQFKDDFPQDGAFNVVLTHDKNLLEKTGAGFVFSAMTPPEVIELARSKGFEQLMLIGGMKTNSLFLNENLVDEIWLSVHPILIGEGLTVMDKVHRFQDLTLLGSKEIGGGLVQLRYELKPTSTL